MAESPSHTPSISCESHVILTRALLCRKHVGDFSLGDSYLAILGPLHSLIFVQESGDPLLTTNSASLIEANGTF